MASSKKKTKSKKNKTQTKPAKKAVAKKVTRVKKTLVAKKGSQAKKTNSQPAKKTKTPNATTPKRLTRELNIDVNIAPLRDRIVVVRDGESDRTPGGLFIPATAMDRPLRGRVMAIGSGLINKKGRIRPLDVKVGETVLFSPYAGSNVTIDGQELLILKEDEVLGISN